MTIYSEDISSVSLKQLLEQLDSLLGVRIKSPIERESLALQYVCASLKHLNLVTDTRCQWASVNDTVTHISQLEFNQFSHLSLYFASEELIFLLATAKIRDDVLLKEEAILYVQERLYRDNFRRISAYDSQKNASFNTYIHNVISNLIIDFCRKSQRDDAKKRYIDEYSFSEYGVSEQELSESSDLNSPEMDDIIDQQKMSHIVHALMESDSENTVLELNNFRQKIRENLNLSAKDRVFLKALYQYDMKINDVRKLPGMNMSTNEAYRYYHEIMLRISRTFRRAGIFRDMRLIFNEVLPTLTVRMESKEVDGPSEVNSLSEMEKVITDLLYFTYHNIHQSKCYIMIDNELREGWLEGSVKELHKQYQYFTSMLSSKVSVTDDQVDDIIIEEGRLKQVYVKLCYITEPFKVAKPYIQIILEKFSKKSNP